MTPVVSVLLVSYQTRELLLRTIAGLRVCRVPYEVVVVDNASTDGSAEAVRAAFPDVTLVALDTNVGFGRAVNVGAARARGEWLVLLNPDTEPVGDPVGELVRYAGEHPGRGLYAGRTLRADGTDDGRSVFALPSLWGYLCFATGLSSLFRRSPWLNPEELPGLDRRAGGPVPAVSGCVLLVERALFGELGGFTPDYFMYSEDIDLSHRARMLGAMPTLVPQAQVVHAGGAASSGTGKRVMLLRGKVTYLRLRWSPLRARLGVALLAVGVAVRVAAARLVGRRSGWDEPWRQRPGWLGGWPATGSPECPAAQPDALPGQSSARAA